MKNRPFILRLGFAISGIRIVWKRERSFRSQVGFAIFASVAVAFLRPPPIWVALVIVCAAMVMALELMNSAIEYMIDHFHPEIAEEIGHAKDAAAGAVLTVSAGALATGILMAFSCWPF